MECPTEVARILLQVLARGLVRIRGRGWEGDPDVCAAEADHLHNIPALISDYSHERLLYYWQFERASYLRTPSHSVDYFANLWDELKPFAEAAERSAKSN